MLNKILLYGEIKETLELIRTAAEMSKGKQSQQQLDELFARRLADSISRFVKSGDVNTSVIGTAAGGIVSGTGTGKVV